MGLALRRRSASVRPAAAEDANVASATSSEGRTHAAQTGDGRQRDVTVSARVNRGWVDQRIARGSLFVAILEAIIITFLVAYIWSTRNTYHLIPIPVALYQDGRVFYTIGKLNTSVSRERVWASDLTAKYLDQRYAITPDASEMDQRWGPSGFIATHSARAVWQAFLAENGRIKDQAHLNGITRRLANVEIVRQDNGLREVNFDVEIVQDGRVQKVTHLRATLTYEWVEQTTTNPDPRRIPNPEGWYVTSYRAAERLP